MWQVHNITGVVGVQCDVYNVTGVPEPAVPVVFPSDAVLPEKFTEENRTKLGTVIGICLANGLGEPTCLPAVFKEHLLKESELPRSVTRLQSALLFPLSTSYG